MNIVSPQPQRWNEYWLYLNGLYTTSELCQRFGWHWNSNRSDVTWLWR